jgi:hypothetical protein
MTATFRSLYVFVLIHHASRQLLHINVTAHPTAAWTLQQLREAIGEEDGYRCLIHDRDSIFAKNLDESLERLGLGFGRVALVHLRKQEPARNPVGLCGPVHRDLDRPPRRESHIPQYRTKDSA